MSPRFLSAQDRRREGEDRQTGQQRNNHNGGLFCTTDLQDQATLLRDGSAIKRHQLRESNKAEVFEILVRILHELSQAGRAELHNIGGVLCQRAVRLFRVWQTLHNG